VGPGIHRRGGRTDAWQHAQWQLAVDALGLKPGEAVLDLGCGSGSAFPEVRAAVAGSGRVVGVDNSPRMLAQATALIAENGWNNVEVRNGDAGSTAVEPSSYDAVIAAYSLSAMGDLDAALQRAHEALRVGGRIFVADMYFGPHPAARLLRQLYRALTGGNGDDVATALGRRFDVVEPVVDKLGRKLVLPEGRSWPPITYLLAHKELA
jgi:ubiquinone/menaquinone biosynthesis C-methylase UbiE